MKTLDEAVNFVANPTPEHQAAWDKGRGIQQELSVQPSVIRWCALQAALLGITPDDKLFEPFCLATLKTFYTGLIVGMEMEKAE